MMEQLDRLYDEIFYKMARTKTKIADFERITGISRTSLDKILYQKKGNIQFLIKIIEVLDKREAEQK